MANLLDTFKNTAVLDNIRSLAFEKMSIGDNPRGPTTAYPPAPSNNFSGVQVPKKIRVYSLSNPDMYILQDLVDENKSTVLIERNNGAPGKCVLKPLGEVKPMMRSFSGSVDGYGIMGIIKLPIGHYLVVITECKLVARILGSEVYGVTDVAFLPFASLDGIDVDSRQNIEKATIELRKWLAGNAFYFSSTYDITTRAQEQIKGTVSYSKIDNRFFWNRFIQTHFIKNKLDEWVLPVMKGFIQTAPCIVNGHKVDVILISRLSSLRAGTRFNTRGVNDEGDVANFVETEQMIISEGKITSFVQTRGSVPVFWEQRMIRGKHRTVISRGSEATAPAFKLHFEDLMKRYGKVFNINLLSNSESEKIITNAYEEQLRVLNNSDIQYTAFDFHERLGKNGLKFNMIGPLLLDSLHSEFLKYGIFVKDSGGNVISTQKGIFRTNCMDCLDRTNVCQGAIARRGFIIALQSLQMLPANQTYDSFEMLHPETEEMYRDIWANNGDNISISYTGTGAMKNGLFRNGKLTIGGIVDDSVKSVLRTYQNNFKDNEKQDIIDMFLGNQSSLETEDLDEEDDFATQLRSRQAEYIETQPLTIFIGTWNVNGKAPGEDLSAWLMNITPSPNLPDIYAIGFQEVVGLTAKSVYNADQTNTQLWHQQILSEISKHQKFVLLRSYQLVGLVLSLFVREDHVPYIKEVQNEIVKVGFKGIAGNKGAISMRFNFHSSSFCFTSAHLAAGNSAVADRNSNYNEIMQNTIFRTSKGPRTIMEHDYVFYFGDLNYRISLDYAEVRRGINTNNYLYLAQYDQLNVEMQNGLIFRGFSEGPLNFPPTYKFDTGTDIYDTSEKRRTPAWCDRVLFRADNIKQFNYKYAPLLTSDHKPVSAVFQVYVKVVNKEKQQKVMEELEKTLGSSSSVGSISSGSGNTGNVPQTMLIDFESDLADASAPSNPTSPKQEHYDPFAVPSSGSNPSSTENIFNMRNSSPPVLPPKNQNNDPFDFFNTPAQPTTNKPLPSIPFSGTQSLDRAAPALPPKPTTTNFFDNFNNNNNNNTTTQTAPALPPKNTGHTTNANSVFNNNNTAAFNQNQARPVDPFFGLGAPMNPAPVNNNNPSNNNSNPFLNMNNNNNMAPNYGYNNNVPPTMMYSNSAPSMGNYNPNSNWNNNGQQQNLQKIQQMQQNRQQNQKPEADPFAMFLNPSSTNTTNNTGGNIPALQPPPPSRSRGRSRPDQPDNNNLFF